jgi:hypothetical protein
MILMIVTQRTYPELHTHPEDARCKQADATPPAGPRPEPALCPHRASASQRYDADMTLASPNARCARDQATLPCNLLRGVLACSVL